MIERKFLYEIVEWWDGWNTSEDPADYPNPPIEEIRAYLKALENPPSTPMLDALRKHLDNTPIEELQKEWGEIHAMGFEGPTVGEFHKWVNYKYTRQSNY